MMQFRRFLALLLSLLMLCSIVPAQAEPFLGNTVEYVGGVVMRTLPRDDPNAELINVAYIRCDAAYYTVGVPYEHEIVISGGAAPYTVQTAAYYQELDATSLSYRGYAFPETDPEDYSFSVTFDREARFMFQISITDAKGQSLVFQSRPFETYPKEDETDATTVAGKVNQIVDKVITPGMSDYARAKALHDWLIFNANYDYTYTHSGADGVLLLGTGVCDSYARAYQLLLTAVGIESTIVTGYGNGGAHGWNLVKLGGSWYHVDCTWDDPGTGGQENWKYFCRTDEQMAVDHQWNRENTDPIVDQNGMIAPEANDTTLAQPDSTRDYDFTFVTTSDLLTGFNNHVKPARKGSLVAKYVGTVDYSTVWSEFTAWCNELYAQYYTECTFGGMSTDGTYFSLELSWNDPQPYLRIDAEQVRGSVGEVITLVIAEQADNMTGVTWTSSNPAVATASSGTVNCLSAGSAVITVKYGSTVLDTVTVTVLAPFEPDLGLRMDMNGDHIALKWNSIPGVTEYRVYRKTGGSVTAIRTLNSTEVTLTSADLVQGIRQEIYVKAVRVVGGTVKLSYESRHYNCGETVYTSVLPADTRTIADSAFLNDASLTNMDIPQGVTAIGASAFKGCAGLKYVRIPASVSSIGSNAFDGCDAISYFEVPAGSYAERWLSQHYPNVPMMH